MNFPEKLSKKLAQRKDNKSLRKLGSTSNSIDFSSNDYLGFSKSETIFNQTHQFLIDNNIKANGATGSRLLSGNHFLYQKTETFLATFHNAESALIFNSGYDANLGFFASVPQRGDVILYDELIHASIRDGIQLSNAKAFKFKHNNLSDLENILKRNRENSSNCNIYIVTESVFSMDGDSPDLVAMSKIINQYENAYFIVDEAHAVGVFNGGLIQQLSLENHVFARIITFGKALGCHGAIALGTKQLTEYLVNFARSFIYTTGLSPHSVATIKTSYEYLLSQNGIKNSKQLQENISFFSSEATRLNLKFIDSNSAIHCCIIGGNEQTKSIAIQFQKNGFEVKPILSPTVKKGEERLRFCLHSYNSKQEITNVLENLATFVASP